MNRNRFFHTLVVLGSSLTGCGQSNPSTGASQADSGNMGTTGGTAAGSDGGAESGIADVVAPPRTPADCAQPAYFQCAADAASGGLGSPGDCFCDPAALTPSDCDTPAHFVCDSYDPYYAHCRCDPSAPTTAADCSQIDAGLGNYVALVCESQMPMYGCRCEMIIGIR